MKYDGRKEVKRHLRVTEYMDEEVRAIAALEHRPIGDQYRFLVDLGLQILSSRRNGQYAERSGEMSPVDAQPILPAPPKVSNGRQMTRRTA